MRNGITNLWYLNVIWGAIFIVLFWLRTASNLILLSTLVLSLIMTATFYFGEKKILEVSLTHKQPKLKLQLEQNPEFDRIMNIGIFFLNLIAYFTLWFVLPNFTRVEEDVYVRTVIWWLFLLVIYSDFARTARIMARNKFLMALTEEQLDDVEKLELKESLVVDSIFTFFTKHRRAGQIYMICLLVLTGILLVLAVWGSVSIWVPVAVFFFGFFIEVGISLVYGAREYRKGIKTEDSLHIDGTVSDEIE